MEIMEKYQKQITDLIKKELPVSKIVITKPPNSKLGDLSLPCFSFAKELKKNPAEIANELKDKIGNLYFIDRIKVTGGYLNFFFNRSVITEDIINEIRRKEDAYGSSMSGKGKKALIEHTSINPNASPHIGRGRNALIGDVIVRLLRFEGYEVDVQYFVNDIGKQIAMLVLGAKDIPDITFENLLNIYIDINNRVKETPELENEVFDLLYKFENGDEEVRAEFRKIVNICITGQTEIFAKLDIKYDTFQYESEYIFDNKTDEILAELKKTGKLFEDPDGRLVLNQEEYNLPLKAPYFVLTRKDKTSLYPLRDIAYTIDKIKANSEKNFVVLGEDQKLYFKQISAALDLLNYKSPSSVHYSFVLLSDGKMSTRNGAVVLLEDFMKEAVHKSLDHMRANKEKIDEKIAQAIAYGAVKYAILKVGNEKNVTFDWETALSFEGDSGPYLQYSYARINSIFKKYGSELPANIDLKVLKEESEFELVKELGNFENVVSKALEESKPNLLANYVYGLTRKFSTFYHECSVLNAENEEVKKARLALLDAVRQVIKNCLSLLGIDVVEYM